jgi:hypothetical protein
MAAFNSLSIFEPSIACISNLGTSLHLVATVLVGRKSSSQPLKTSYQSALKFSVARVMIDDRIQLVGLNWKLFLGGCLRDFGEVLHKKWLSLTKTGLATVLVGRKSSSQPLKTSYHNFGNRLRNFMLLRVMIDDRKQTRGPEFETSRNFHGQLNYGIDLLWISL